ncbi:MAG: type II toxin-antitoxin system CcdA family antitoxin [Sphingomonadales bacterium]|jgi:antitoxin CcdA|nr:type II toxin-antitoxin system CcdA family antitoxin [Sphingomonadales bacterium]MBK9004021.1 type II toxin-antitoxin system CcdA family antitoxin [Sphingomonadales bacterium]MBK9269195.1 type II toxin-antitoxin system CcdA family antitoxin [Sphingomonadales bacterium]
MNKPSRFSAPKKPTNVSLPADMVEEAKRLGINVSQACEAGLSKEVRKALGEEWKRENKEAIESWNKWVAENGLPLAKYRQF